MATVAVREYGRGDMPKTRPICHDQNYALVSEGEEGIDNGYEPVDCAPPASWRGAGVTEEQAGQSSTLLPRPPPHTPAVFAFSSDRDLKLIWRRLSQKE